MIDSRTRFGFARFFSPTPRFIVIAPQNNMPFCGKRFHQIAQFSTRGTSIRFPPPPARATRRLICGKFAVWMARYLCGRSPGKVHCEQAMNLSPQPNPAIGFHERCECDMGNGGPTTRPCQQGSVGKNAVNFLPFLTGPKRKDLSDCRLINYFWLNPIRKISDNLFPPGWRRATPGDDWEFLGRRDSGLFLFFILPPRTYIQQRDFFYRHNDLLPLTGSPGTSVISTSLSPTFCIECVDLHAFLWFWDILIFFPSTVSSHEYYNAILELRRVLFMARFVCFFLSPRSASEIKPAKNIFSWIFYHRWTTDLRQKIFFFRRISLPLKLGSCLFVFIDHHATLLNYVSISFFSSDVSGFIPGGPQGGPKGPLAPQRCHPLRWLAPGTSGTPPDGAPGVSSDDCPCDVAGGGGGGLECHAPHLPVAL